MSIIRMLARLVALLAVVAAAVPVVGGLLATPAAAFGLHLQSGSAAPMFARRSMAPSAVLSANRGTVSLQSYRVPSTAKVSTRTAAAGAVRAPSLPRTTHVRSNVTRIATGDAVPGGSSTIAPGGGSALPGGGIVGAGNGPAGGFRTATPGATADTSGGTRSLNDPGWNRSSITGTGTTNSQTTTNTTTQSTTKTNTTAPNTRTTTTLRAVTVCMTSAGACPMERDVGTACQCKDMQGNVYDGIVK
jgi:hypothetical protein